MNKYKEDLEEARQAADSSAYSAAHWSANYEGELEYQINLTLKTLGETK